MQKIVFLVLCASMSVAAMERVVEIDQEAINQRKKAIDEKYDSAVKVANRLHFEKTGLGTPFLYSESSWPNEYKSDLDRAVEERERELAQLKSEYNCDFEEWPESTRWADTLVAVRRGQVSYDYAPSRIIFADAEGNTKVLSTYPMSKITLTDVQGHEKVINCSFPYPVSKITLTDGQGHEEVINMEDQQTVSEIK
jgi:hypothetical protein